MLLPCLSDGVELSEFGSETGRLRDQGICFLVWWMSGLGSIFSRSVGLLGAFSVADVGAERWQTGFSARYFRSWEGFLPLSLGNSGGLDLSNTGRREAWLGSLQ